MKNIGPSLESMTRRLLDTPAEFLAEPRIGTTGMISVPALVNDVLMMHGHGAEVRWLDAFAGAEVRASRNRLALAMIVAWLLADDWFVSERLAAADLCRLFDNPARELADATPAHKFATDTGHCEELARVVLARFGYRPLDETLEQASDRLVAVSGAARRKLLAASRESEKRAREVREALAKKAAEESADKWTRD